MDSSRIVCAKTGQPIPASSVNNFQMVFGYCSGGKTGTYRASFSESVLKELEEELAEVFNRFVDTDAPDEG